MNRHAFALLFAFFAPLAFAEVKLPAIIGDNMALQRGKNVPIWGWAEPGEKVKVCLNGKNKSAKADCEGKWRVCFDLKCPGGPYDMTVTGCSNTLSVHNILVGEVWVCSGQSNMEFVVNSGNDAANEKQNAKYPNIRLFTVKKSVKEEPQTDCVGKWVECSPDTVGSFSAVGYFFGRKLYQDLNVPVGLIHTSWGGTPAEAWTTRATLQSDPDFKPIDDRFVKAKADDTPENFAKREAAHKAALEKWKADAEKAKADNKPAPQQPRPPQHAVGPNSPATLYNGMIAPLIPYKIAGATWYQGESNAGRAYQYRKLLPAMIRDWRCAWGQGDFPFMIVQLANFMAKKPEPSESSWAELREAQTLTALHTPNTGIGLAIDIGDDKDIHPKNKQDVGLRLALQALKIAYGRDIAFSGPMYQALTVNGNAARVYFKYDFDGLVAKGGDLKGFAIAGEDKKWYWASAKIEGNSVIVSSDKVSAPVAVRYDWADNPDGNLYNGKGLPALPFRTDDWKGVTADAK